jgi:hypothetical protein
MTTTTADVPGSLAGSLALVQSQLPRITKDKTAQVKSDKGSYTYSYADLAAVSAEILPLLGRCGLAWVTQPTFNPDGRFVLAYQLMHVGGDTIKGEYPLPNAGTPQAMGSAITYARRYTLCSITGVAPDTDDDDAAQATQQARPRQTVNPRQRREDPEPDARPTRQVQRRQQSAAERRTEGPPLPGEDGPPAAASRADGRPDPLTSPQRAQVNILLGGKMGVGAAAMRPEKLRIVSEIVRRRVESTNDLTKAEASRLIDVLDRHTREQVYEVIGQPPGEVPAAPAEVEPSGPGSDPWDEPAERDGSDE